MAQDYVPLLRSVWQDQDWRDLTAAAQHTYWMALSSPTRNSAGVLPLTVRKWVRLASGLTVELLQTSMAQLDDAGFLVVDEDTEEVLVRSYIRRATVYKHVRMFAVALRQASEVESERLRSALGQELARLPKVAIPERNDRMADEAREVQRRLDELVSVMCDAPPALPAESAGRNAGDGVADGSAHGMTDGLAHPRRVGAGVVAGVGAGAVGGSSFSKDHLSSLVGNAGASATLLDTWRAS